MTEDKEEFWGPGFLRPQTSGTSELDKVTTEKSAHSFLTTELLHEVWAIDEVKVTEIAKNETISMRVS